MCITHDQIYNSEQNLFRATQVSLIATLSQARLLFAGLLAQLMASLVPRAGLWDPDPDWFDEFPHCPVCGQPSLEGDILPRYLMIEFKKWVEARNEDGLYFLKQVTIPLVVKAWFHRECLRTYEGRTGGA